MSRMLNFFMLIIISAVTAFSPLKSNRFVMPSLKSAMLEITKGVQFDTIAREWRLKWSADSDKKSLQSVQQTLSLFEKELSTIKGVKSVQRIVCGGCLDYKVIVAVAASDFGDWEGKKFQPEEVTYKCSILYK